MDNEMGDTASLLSSRSIATLINGTMHVHFPRT